MFPNYEPLLEALRHIAPQFEWEEMPTGGGCNCIEGTHRSSKKSIQIHDDAHAPQTFLDEACATYWDDERNAVLRRTKDQTESIPFFKLLQVIESDIAEWENEKNELDEICDRLTKFASELSWTEFATARYGHEKLISDILTAVHLLKTHAE